MNSPRIWVATFVSNKVMKSRASDGTILGVFPIGSRPSALAFDGAKIRVVKATT